MIEHTTKEPPDNNSNESNTAGATFTVRGSLTWPPKHQPAGFRCSPIYSSTTKL